MNVKYTKEVLSPIVLSSYSIAEVIRKLEKRFSGGLHGHLTSRIKIFGIDTSHFSRVGCNKGKKPSNKLSYQKVLVKGRLKIREDTFRLRRALMESGVEYKCGECNLPPIWNDKPICIQVEHKDGDWSNNTPENLMFICPNCHSQTDTFGVKNAAVV